MNIRVIFAIFAATAAAKPLSLRKGLTEQKQAPTRKGRATRKLLDEIPEEEPARQEPQRMFPVVGPLVAMPRNIVSGLLSGQGSFQDAQAVPGYMIHQNIGELVDKTRNIADSSFDTIEMLASGLTQRGKGAIDRATQKAANVVDSGVSFSSNGLGSSVEAVRGLQSEAKRVAHGAAQTLASGIEHGPANPLGFLGNPLNFFNGGLLAPLAV